MREYLQFVETIELFFIPPKKLGRQIKNINTKRVTIIHQAKMANLGSKEKRWHTKYLLRVQQYLKSRKDKKGN